MFLKFYFKFNHTHKHTRVHTGIPCVDELSLMVSLLHNLKVILIDYRILMFEYFKTDFCMSSRCIIFSQHVLFIIHVRMLRVL